MSICPQCGVDHQGLCHKCVHNGKVAGDWKHSPCRHCKPAEALQQGHGRNPSFDEIEPIIGEWPKDEEDAPENRLLDVLRVFLGLDAIGREIIFRYLTTPESSLQDVANYLAETFKRPFTLQAVHWRIRVMEKQGPVFVRLLERVDRRIGIQ